jgi:hypothetical protein
MLGHNEYEKSELNVSFTFLDRTYVTLNAPFKQILKESWQHVKTFAAMLD